MSEPDVLDEVQDLGAAGRVRGERTTVDRARLLVDRLVLAHAVEEALEILFSHNPRARIIWAHTGFGTPLPRLEELLAKYPALVGELSYRSDVATGDGGLAAPWAALFRKHPTRFVVGSDTWVNQRWESYSALMGGYRKWLGELPEAVAQRIAWRNAAELFGLE